MLIPDFAGDGESRVGVHQENDNASSFSRGWDGCFVIWKAESKNLCSRMQ